MSDRRERSSRSLWFFPSHRAPRPAIFTVGHRITAKKLCRPEIPAGAASSLQPRHQPAQTNNPACILFIPAGVTCAVSGYKSSIRFADVILNGCLYRRPPSPSSSLHAGVFRALRSAARALPLTRELLKKLDQNFYYGCRRRVIRDQNFYFGAPAVCDSRPKLLF